MLKKKPVSFNEDEFGLHYGYERGTAYAQEVWEVQGDKQIPDEQALNWTRIGVRNDLGGVIPKLLDARVTNRYIQEILPRELAEEKRLGTTRRYQLRPGFWGKLRQLSSKIAGGTTLVGTPVLRAASTPAEKFEGEFQFNPELGMLRNCVIAVLSELTTEGKTLIENRLAGSGTIISRLEAASISSLQDLRSKLEPQHFHDQSKFTKVTSDPLFPSARRQTPQLAIDRLIEYKKIKAEETHKMIATTIYDPQRLGQVIAKFEKAADDSQWKKMWDGVEKILEPDPLYHLSTDSSAKALVHYLESKAGDTPDGTRAKQVNALIQKIIADNNAFPTEEPAPVPTEGGDTAPEKKIRLKPFELLKALIAQDLKEKTIGGNTGIATDDMREITALTAARILCANVENVQVFRSANLEIAQAVARRASSPLGRVGNWLNRRLGQMETYTAERIINNIAGMGDSRFRVFHGMPKDITIEEMINRLDQDGMYDEKVLHDFTEKLKTMFVNFERLEHDGKVEIREGDAFDLERIIMMLTTLRKVLRSKKFIDSLQGTEKKAAAILKKLRDDRKAEMEDEKSIIAKVMEKGGEWLSFINRKIFKTKFLDKLKDARTKAKEGKIRGREFDAQMWERGLHTAHTILTTGLIADEILEAVRSRVPVVGRKKSTKKGEEKLTAAKKKKGGKIMKRLRESAGWLGDKLVVKPVKWTAGAAWKTLKFPFTLAGVILSPITGPAVNAYKVIAAGPNGIAAASQATNAPEKKKK